MRHLAILILMFALAACHPAGQTPSAGISRQTQIDSAETDAAPVYVPALCTLMGHAARSDVPAGHPVIVMWGWSAATEEQVKDYIRTRIEIVTFDGKEIRGEQQGGIPFDKSANVYRAVWMSKVGVPKPSLHVITYALMFREKIFDGVSYYGPGTKNERQEDRCEIEVK